ncbi:MAG: GMP synthase [Bacteroidota bacterium]
MRCIREMLTACDGRFHNTPIAFEVFETRYDGVMPDLDAFDAFISSGGPGSPYDGEGLEWEANYFAWLDALWQHNQSAAPAARKYALFICHSFQLIARHFGFAEVTQRRSPSFGVFPVHQTDAGKRDALFSGLANPFYAADFRSWQVVKPKFERFRELGATILCTEKKRPHIPLERALMGVRLSPELVGVQFHPEADPRGMSLHFHEPERRDKIVAAHGQEKYERIMHRLEAPNFLKRTHDTIMPNFLRMAARKLHATARQAA